jgi:DHA2 family multidrug resistance protein
LPKREDLATAGAIIGVLFLCGIILGPLVGGLINVRYTWRYIFYINIPILIVSYLLIRIKLFKFNTLRGHISIDVLGFIGLFICSVSSQFIFDKGQDWGWWDSDAIRILICIIIIVLPFSVIWVLFNKRPILNFMFFKHKPMFLFSTILYSIGQSVENAYTVLLPLWVQTYQGYDAYWAAIVVLPLGIGTIIGSVLYSSLLKYIGYQTILVSGFLISSISCFYECFHLTTQIDIFHMQIPRGCFGFGLALSYLAIGALYIPELKGHKTHEATILMQYFRALCTGAATALFVVFWGRRTTRHHFDTIERIVPSRPVVQKSLNLLEQQGMTRTQAISNLNDMTDKQAALLAFNDFLWIVAWVLLVCALLLVVNKRIYKISGTAADLDKVF